MGDIVIRQAKYLAKQFSEIIYIKRLWKKKQIVLATHLDNSPRFFMSTDYEYK